jgi:hypothetical protein
MTGSANFSLNAILTTEKSLCTTLPSVVRTGIIIRNNELVSFFIKNIVQGIELLSARTEESQTNEEIVLCAQSFPITTETMQVE